MKELCCVSTRKRVGYIILASPFCNKKRIAKDPWDSINEREKSNLANHCFHSTSESCK